VVIIFNLRILIKKTLKFWRCANRNCAALLHTTLDDEFVCYSGRVADHSHLPNPAELQVRNLREKMRERAENEILPLQVIAEKRTKELYDRFNNNQINVKELLRGLSLFVANAK